MSALIAKAMRDTAMSDFEKEVCYQTPRQEGEGGVLKTVPHRGSAFRGRQFYTLDGPASGTATDFWGQRHGGRGLEQKALEPAGRIGSLPVRAYPVDHSIFGAAAFALETEAGWVVYTGDQRLHGKRGLATEKFMRSVAELRPYLLLCEGTHVEAKATTSEDEVHENCLGAVSGTRGLVVADFGPRNVERLISFRGIAAETGRKLAILPKDAYLLEAMRAADTGVPEVGGDETIRIYSDLKAREEKSEQELLGRCGGKVVDAAEVRRHQSEYILCLSF